jgi:type VI secretion system secreted protein Hcp
MSFDTFLKFTGGNDVKGESTADGHKDEIEIYSFSWGASNPTTIGSGSGGLTGGKVSISSFNVMKKTELSSAKLFAACCSGQHFDTAVVSMRKATGVAGKQQEFLNYTFENVMIESIQWSGSSGGDDSPTESLSIAFGKVTIKYSKQEGGKGDLKPAGEASWDLTTVTK